MSSKHQIYFFYIFFFIPFRLWPLKMVYMIFAIIGTGEGPVLSGNFSIVDNLSVKFNFLKHDRSFVCFDTIQCKWFGQFPISFQFYGWRLYCNSWYFTLSVPYGLAWERYISWEIFSFFYNWIYLMYFFLNS